MSLGVRLAGYVAATVLLPLVAIVVALLAVVEARDEELLLRMGLALAGAAAVVAYASLSIAYRAVARASDALAERARGVSIGHFGGEPVRTDGPRELVRLGQAFNDMLATVRAHEEERDRSEGEFRHSVERLGTALSGSHDPHAIGQVTTETAALVTGCRTALLWVVEGSELAPRHVSGEGRVRSPLSLGEGLAGSAAALATPRAGDERAAGEPHHEHAMAAPLTVDGEVWGVLAAYGRRGTTIPYSLDDVAVLARLAQQAETAVENAQLHAEVTRLSMTDPLTGLANRREMERRMDLEVERADRSAEPFSLALLDVDDFKVVNDSFGHPAGDAVLVELAQRLRRITRAVDLVARTGGEELAVLLPTAHGPTAVEAAMRMRRVVAGRPVVVDGVEISVTCSVGLATYPAHAGTAADLVAAADEALYRAKAQGKNRIEWADAADGHRARRSLPSAP